MSRVHSRLQFFADEASVVVKSPRGIFLLQGADIPSGARFVSLEAVPEGLDVRPWTDYEYIELPRAVLPLRGLPVDIYRGRSDTPGLLGAADHGVLVGLGVPEVVEAWDTDECPALRLLRRRPLFNPVVVPEREMLLDAAGNLVPIPEQGHTISLEYRTRRRMAMGGRFAYSSDSRFADMTARIHWFAAPLPLFDYTEQR